VAVYNYALSATQVKTHYAKGIGAVVVTPTLEIARSGANTVLTWTQGLLLQAGSVTGPWTTNSTAVSPWTNALSQGQQFYRVFVP
jgi:hypothetical protein